MKGFTILTVQKLGQSILLQLVKVYFQWIDLCGLFHVRDGLHTQLTFAAAFTAIKYAKKAPNQADNFANFSEMLLSKDQLFGSSAGSDLQAIKLQYIAPN